MDDKYIEGLASCDIDNDGKDELIVLTNYDYYSGSPQIGQLLIFSWNNNSFQLIWQSQEINGYPYGIQIADINNDNFDDILVSCSGVQLFMNNSGTISYYGQISTTTPDDLFLVADLNNDDTDILSGELYSGEVNVFKNNQSFDFDKSFAYKFDTRIKEIFNLKRSLQILIT